MLFCSDANNEARERQARYFFVGFPREEKGIIAYRTLLPPRLLLVFGYSLGSVALTDLSSSRFPPTPLICEERGYEGVPRVPGGGVLVFPGRG